MLNQVVSDVSFQCTAVHTAGVAGCSGGAGCGAVEEIHMAVRGNHRGELRAGVPATG